MTELYLITDPEYQLFLAALKNAGSAPKDQAMLKLHFSQKTADLNWEEEIAYQLAEDTLIGIAVPMERRERDGSSCSGSREGFMQS